VSSRSYIAHIIYCRDGQPDIYPPPTQQINDVCIGYMRVLLPKPLSQPQQGSPQQSGLELVYTGHPCHRTWAILVAQSQQRRTVQVSNQTPIIEILRCKSGPPSGTVNVDLPVNNISIVNIGGMRQCSGVRNVVQSFLPGDMITYLPDEVPYVMV